VTLSDAKDTFLGKNGHKRLNCAQVMAKYFSSIIDIEENTIKNFKKMGHGKAPNGECGIYFAGKYILNQAGKDRHQKDFETKFMEIAGTTQCKELRKMKLPFCSECIKDTAEYIENRII
jgi:hypothetical protein